MGRTTSRDGALQLLLLMDLIYDWGCNIFRFDILCSLAGGRDNLRGATPTHASRFSTQEPSLHEVSLNELLPEYTPEINMDWSTFDDEDDGDDDDMSESNSTTTPTDTNKGIDTINQIDSTAPQSTLIDLTLEQHFQETASNSHVDMIRYTQKHPFLRWVKTADCQIPYSQTLTVMHANMGLFEFSHISLPEDEDSLSNIVSEIAESSGCGRTSCLDYLILTFDSPDPNCISTTTEVIDLMKSIWLKRPAQPSMMRTPTRAIVQIHTFFRMTDWQIVRRLACITCSLQALQKLFQIRNNKRSHPLGQQLDEIDVVPLSILDEMRFLTGLVAVSAAFNRMKLNLRKCRDEYLFVQCQSGLHDAIFDAFHNKHNLEAFIHGRSEIIEIFEQPTPKYVQRLTGPLLDTNASVVLLRKPLTLNLWPPESSEWCCIILKEIDFDNPSEMRKLFGELLQSRVYFSRPLALAVPNTSQLTEDDILLLRAAFDGLLTY
jgi:hypothetical protein